MKASDLMVGDWVSYCGFYNKVIYIGQKVSMYNGKGTEFTTDPEHIRPIPLTEEILVKNGFEKRIYTSPSNNEDYRYYQWNPTPEYPDEGVWLWPDGDSYTYNSRISDIKINSVHQLQHLLRLCGIEKEIEL
jgi:hypothetical protein